MTPDLDATYTDGSLTVKADIRNLDKKSNQNYKVYYRFMPTNSIQMKIHLSTDSYRLSSNGSTRMKTTENLMTIKVKAPNKWSAEQPYRYTLVAELKDKKNKTIDMVSTTVGFRKVEIKDTPASEDEFGLAGRYY